MHTPYVCVHALCSDTYMDKFYVNVCACVCTYIYQYHTIYLLFVSVGACVCVCLFAELYVKKHITITYN